MRSHVVSVLSLVGSLFLSGISAQAGWYKGNLHTHTLWSDGDDFPEMVAGWYREHGYQFLVFSDHNSLQEGEKWVPMNTTNRLSALAKYEVLFGPNWVQQSTHPPVLHKSAPSTSTAASVTTPPNASGEVPPAAAPTNYVRLKSFQEFHRLFQKKGKFLLMQGEEISTHRLSTPIHVGAINVREAIVPRTGETIIETIQNNIDSVLAQRARTGQPMFPHLNHPNFRWAITAEEMMQIRGDLFFEVYNGHTLVHNEGDSLRANTERVWDISLTRRLTELNLGVVYGIATDDSHNYHGFGPMQANPGRGWVVVRASALTASKLIEAMEAGDFYASSGVTLKDVRVNARSYTVKVQPEKDVAYRIQFIGTRRNFDPQSQPVKNEKGEEPRVTRHYSKDVGMVLAEQAGTTATYLFRGDEIYVRAKVISSKINLNSEAARTENPSPTALESSTFGYEAAWTQPVVLHVAKK